MKWMRLVLLVGLVFASFLPASEAASGCSSGLLFCQNGSVLSCSCSTGGTCQNNPSGNPWGGYVVCTCPGMGPNQLSCNAPVSGCSPRACDTQCGGPGFGRCVGNTCHCL